MNNNIQTMSSAELKAFAYDFIAEKERLENNLRQINQRILIKLKEEQEEIEKKAKEKVEKTTEEVKKDS